MQDSQSHPKTFVSRFLSIATFFAIFGLGLLYYPFQSSISPTIRAILIWALAGVWLCVFAYKYSFVSLAKKYWQDPRFILLGLFILSILVSTILARDISFALLGNTYIRLGSTTTLAAIIVAFGLREQYRPSWNKYIFSAIVLATCLSLLLFWHSIEKDGIRIYGLFAQPNALAVIVAVGLIFSLFVSTKHQVYIWMGRGILLSGLLLTKSRGILFITGALIGLYYIWIWLTQSKNVVVSITKRRLLFFGLTVCIVLSIGLINHPLKRIFDSHYLIESVQYKNELYVHGWRLAEKTPVFGSGINSIVYRYGTEQPLSPMLQATYDEGIIYYQTHNIFLDVWIETGTFGLIVFGLLNGCVIWRMISNQNIILYPFYLTYSLLFLQLQYNIPSLEFMPIYWACVVMILFCSSNKGVALS